MDLPQSRRIHIGNISQKLAESKDSLEARLGKFGKVTGSIDLRTKPVNDFYYAFVDMEILDKQFEKLKMSLNGILFMGRKLTISLAKEDYLQRWKKDSGRPETSKAVLAKQANIAAARIERIREANAKYPVNSMSGAMLQSTSSPAPNNSSMGYLCSPHTFNGSSANTKNKAPSHDLIGKLSYGATLKPRGTYSQQYSRTSGRAEVIKGRLRTTPRPASHFIRREQTMRLLINGELKQIKCYKTKLWGVEKKAATELTYKFSDGAWRSGDDHIVERVDKCGVNGAQAARYGVEARHEPTEEVATEEVSSNVLERFFETFDFDKPVAIEEKSDDEDAVTLDSKGRKNVELYDFETKGVVRFEESRKAASQGGESLQEYLLQHERPQTEVYFDEDDEGNELEMDGMGQKYSTEATKKTYDEEHGIEQHEKNKERVTDTKNETETLRSLFEPSKPTNGLFAGDSGFKLGLDESDEDIDVEKKQADEEEQRKLAEQIALKQQQQEEEEFEAVRASSKTFGLFWTHFESPFLQTQTQLSKIGHANEKITLPGEENGPSVRDDGHGEEDAYETWFWLMRGEVSRECKRRRRDVLRTLKKRHIRPII